ncbi:MAG: 2-oxoglutarate dehydrogenase complex dihydrolipoyllysine-residue succinyltransferase [Polyangiaceae bacterium]|nr:2-oxoglutarate dehydrogenase complex dihydrolipoyllysine-residue succinyltransferase [Polyangiaceae bacterium]
MAILLKVPSVGESITEVQVGEWLKKVGDTVRRDESLVMIETDKVTVELPAPADGVLTEIRIATGAKATVGDVVGSMEEAASAVAQAPQKSAPPPAPPKDAPAILPAPEAPQASRELDSIRESLPPQAFARVMPAARHALHEHGLTAEQVPASGPGGRLLKEDVQRRAELGKAPPAPPPAPTPTPSEAPGRAEEIVPMSPFRRRIAERLVQSQQTAALLTTFNEVDMSHVMELRKQYQPQFQERYGVKLGFMSFFVKAAIDALKLVPQVNAEIRGDNLVFKNFYDIGVAVGGGKGLAVPVIRNAERLSFAEVEQKIAEFGKRAKENKLKLEEMQGGTFTISNGGVYGSLLSTPIINPPQSGILGLHGILDRPIAENGAVVIRPMMYIAMTYDHRIVDGREAVTFLKRIKECVENPTRILLEV